MPVEQRDLSGIEFWAAYMSKDVKQRRFAEMYLVGVLDSSEGYMWCGYDQVKGGSIQELLYRKLSKANEEFMAVRASHLITNILADSLPCRERK
ncbi:hypothetical protein GCM10025791_44650 [Halioxenophilus aromaticivorans]|uniref:Rap1a immunity protein domain-containing protein n=2 Tax=Halioxenophilus aromaticivorans TaxID=1306992 RepID=A0AAV3U929_9ALTE